MRIKAGDTDAWLLGDPHLGRKFETGVPLHRRGEREKLQLAKFIEELNTPDVHVVVCVGDLFDHPHVGYHVVLGVYEAIRQAINDIVIMGGNHDEPRNLSVVSAIDLLEKLCEPLGHVTIVRKDPQQWGSFALFPWDWTSTAEEQVSRFQQTDEVEAICGHWDLISFGGDESHMAPVKAIRDMISSEAPIYTGHYHLEGDYEVDGVTVHCTGSMEPYSHAEDPNGERYVTLTLEELRGRDDLADKCVRVLLAEGEELPTDLDCLALTSKRASAGETSLEQIDLDHFSWKEILEEALEPLQPHVREFIQDKLKETEVEL